MIALYVGPQLVLRRMKTHTHTHTHTKTHTHTHTCMYVCMYVYTMQYYIYDDSYMCALILVLCRKYILTKQGVFGGRVKGAECDKRPAFRR